MRGAGYIHGLLLKIFKESNATQSSWNERNSWKSVHEEFTLTTTTCLASCDVLRVPFHSTGQNKSSYFKSCVIMSLRQSIFFHFHVRV